MQQTQLPLIILLLLLSSSWLSAQNITQTIRGTVLDEETQTPLMGATIAILDTDPRRGDISDENGYFKIPLVQVGRHSIQVTYLGYEPLTLSEIMLTSGKELVLVLKLRESTHELEEVVITATHDKSRPLNEFASVSARSFSVEETQRYASSFYDPARMAQSFAGVFVGGATDDLFNEIVVRGNSPRGMLWRLEGIEIPNPNHFASLGNSGGAISMLSSSTLTSSDFYTGAFPTEFGNATAGVFDLNMRAGNNEKREYSLMVGSLGLEAAAEGFFSRNSRASYLINYRYSTLAALSAVNLNPVGDILPAYQDLSFKINVPTKYAGTFSLFGLGGANISTFHPEADSTTWTGKYDHWGFTEKQRLGTIGLSHRILITDNSYLKTVVLASHNSYLEDDYYLDKTKNYEKVAVDLTDYTEESLRVSTTYLHKFNARNTLKAGLIASRLSFDFLYEELNEEETRLVRLLDNYGQTEFYQAFVHWKLRLKDAWTINTGVHYSHFAFNDKYSIEPRFSMQWQIDPKHSLSASAGLHSKLEHLAIYLFEGTLLDGTPVSPNKQLPLSKAMHAVLAYDLRFNEYLRVKTELYYQHLYDIPIEGKAGSKRSLINAIDIWSVLGADSVTSNGKGRNYGIDFTLEKFFSNQYYYMVTASLYESKYSPQDGLEYNTRFNGNYQMNLLGGKEFKIGRKRNNILGLNARFIVSGGNRYTPIDLEASRQAGKDIRYADRPFEARAGQYMRLDAGVSYKINKKRTTHSIMVDVQNVTNHQNVFGLYYDTQSEQIEKFYQTGLLPVVNYRLEF